MRRRRISRIAAVALAAVVVAGCSGKSPTEPEEIGFFEAIGAYGRVAGTNQYNFELADPKIAWQVSWVDEYNAGGGMIGGAKNTSSSVDLVGGIWAFSTLSNLAWDWSGYTSTQPDGIILSTYPHKFLSKKKTAKGNVKVNVKNTTTGKKGLLIGTVTGGIIEEVLLPGGWALRIYATFDITKGRRLMKGYTGNGFVESIFDYTTQAWLQNSVSLTLTK